MKKTKEEELVKETKQLDNFIIKRMADDSFLIHTTAGVVLGIYKTDEPMTITIAMLFSNLEEETSKMIMRNLCISLLVSHSAVIIEPDYLSKIVELYVENHKSVREKIDKAGDEAGTPKVEMTEEEMLDDVEMLEKIKQSDLIL